MTPYLKPLISFREISLWPPSRCGSASLVGPERNVGDDATCGWYRSEANTATSFTGLGCRAVPGAGDGDAASYDGASAASLRTRIRALLPATDTTSTASAETQPSPAVRGCGGRRGETVDLGRGPPVLDGRELPTQLLRPHR